ncbi:MAG: hypothetical protein ACRDJN_25575 [Chloroflexota bacterium]
MEPNETPTPEPPADDQLRRAKRHAKELLLPVDGVQGVGIGAGTLRVYVRDASVAHGLPAEVDGVTVEPVVVGEAITY